MARHVWSVLCSKSIEDKATNNLTLFEVLEQVTLNALPGADPLAQVEQSRAQGKTPLVPIPFELVTLFARSNIFASEAAHCRVRLFAPSGEELGEPEARAMDLHRFQRYRGRAQFDALPFAGFGRYEFAVELNSGDSGWQQVAKVPLDVLDGSAVVGGSAASE
jgi:hypothetical protein